VIKDNYNKYNQLRKEYKFFAFEGFSIKDDEDKLSVVYDFNLSDRFSFHPGLEIKKGVFFKNDLPEHVIENFVFHIGMVELISYWKAACPKQIIVKPFNLDDWQISWWKHLYFHGLGEFFFLNNIQADKAEMVEIICESDRELKSSDLNVSKNQVLVPIGGGKDSVVTLELLKDQFNCIPLIINPREASLKTISTAGYTENEFIEIRRTIHPQLLKLNEKGFLNGHTPFSAMLAFVSAFVAGVSGSKFIALSNESSANEPTDVESGVNHQYSKSYEFEKDFRDYVTKYISSDVEYFSFLRPLTEYTIASLFSDYLQYFGNFKSCNVGSKADSWCGKCSKCLFTLIILSPFVSKDDLIRIFGKDLFEDPDLLNVFNELTGLSEIKPFECVGTIDEVNAALITNIQNYTGSLPYLLEYYKDSPNFKKYRNIDPKNFLKPEENDHFLKEEFFNIIKNQINA